MGNLAQRSDNQMFGGNLADRLRTAIGPRVGNVPPPNNLIRGMVGGNAPEISVPSFRSNNPMPELTAPAARPAPITPNRPDQLLGGAPGRNRDQGRNRNRDRNRAFSYPRGTRGMY